jgi:putative endonuclease
MEDKHDNKIKGNCGEDAAAEFLAAHGFKIIARNYSCALGEIDIAALAGDVLHFMEVKMRTADFIPGRFAVNRRKQAHIKKAASNFMLQNKLNGKYFVSFDVIEITDGKIEFLQNCFY